MMSELRRYLLILVPGRIFFEATSVMFLMVLSALGGAVLGRTVGTTAEGVTNIVPPWVQAGTPAVLLLMSLCVAIISLLSAYINGSREVVKLNPQIRKGVNIGWSAAAAILVTFSMGTLLSYLPENAPEGMLENWVMVSHTALTLIFTYISINGFIYGSLNPVKFATGTATDAPESETKHKEADTA